MGIHEYSPCQKRLKRASKGAAKTAQNSLTWHVSEFLAPRIASTGPGALPRAGPGAHCGSKGPHRASQNRPKLNYLASN